MLKKVIDQLRAELTALDEELRVRLPREIDNARQHGDLKENAEYHAAKDRQKFVEAKISQLNIRLKELSAINLDRLPPDRAGLFSTLKVVDLASGDELTYTIVTNEEGDLKQGLVSLSSPLGKGFVGRQGGDEVEIQTPGGARSFEILEVITLHQKNGK